MVSRCPWTSILERGHDPLKFYESPGDGRYLQLVARFHGMEEVRGSNPLCSTRREDRLTGKTPSQLVFFLPSGDGVGRFWG